MDQSRSPRSFPDSRCALNFAPSPVDFIFPPASGRSRRRNIQRIARPIARRIALGLLAVLPLLPFAAQAQSDWPNRPVRIIVAYPPGQSTDIATRYFANKLTQAFNQSFFVENKPGASGNIGTAA